MHIYETLAKYQKGIDIRHSDDYVFYMNHRHMFSDITMYRFLFDAKDGFDIVRANIIIHALKNKDILDKSITYAFKESEMKTEDVEQYIQEKMMNRPFFKDNGIKIYIPIFSRAINSYYYGQYGKILTEPYSKLLSKYQTSCIDLFEMYNFSLYDSLFTKLVVVYKDEKICVVYHFDFRTIYIINDQGRLDAKIALFDKFIKRIDLSHVIERIKPVIDCYLKDDKEGMLDALTDNKLVSYKLIQKIKKNERRHNRLLERKAR